MGQLKRVEYSEIKWDQMYLVHKAEDDEQTAIEAELISLSGDEIITELKERFPDSTGEDLYYMLCYLEDTSDAEDGFYHIYEIPVPKK